MALGAYAVERDYSHYVSYLAKTIYAVVGTASRGPIGEAVRCTSAQDLVNKFGTLRPDCYGLYAGQYFLSQSSNLYFVRAAHEDAAASHVSAPGKGSGSSTIDNAITFSMLEKGTYGDGYSVVITKESEKYTVVIKNASGATLESTKDMTFEQLTKYEGNYAKVTASSELATEVTAGTYVFADGNDGITNITAADYINAAKALESEHVDMNLFAVPGVSDASVITAMLSLAETRGDCMYLVDPPKGLTRDGVIAWHKGGGSYEHAAFNSSYGALYYDWVTIYDSINKVKVTVPPSVPVAASYAYSDRTAEVWYAPAGLTRGLVRGVLNTATKLSKADVNLLYEGDNSINAIYEDPQVGLVLWGQKTLQKNDTALNRVNVRRLLNYLKRVVVSACNVLTFEPNDRVTWNHFEALVQPTLDSIKERRGIYEYRIVRGETIVTNNDIDNYRMPCMIMIQPTKAAEDIPIYFTITSTGANFNEVLEQNGIVV